MSYKRNNNVPEVEVKKKVLSVHLKKSQVLKMYLTFRIFRILIIPRKCINTFKYEYERARDVFINWISIWRMWRCDVAVGKFVRGANEQ